MKLRVVSLSAVLLLSACQNIGSRQMKPERLNYNKAVHYSEKQQQLLNIVRLRYGDSPLFLNLNSIVTQLQYEHTAALNVLAQQYNVIQGGGDLSVRYMEIPTITYTPLGGLDYIKRLLTPIDLRVIYFLLDSGWGSNHVFNLMIQKIGEIDNASSASRSASTHPPHYKDFRALGEALLETQKRNNLRFSTGKINNVFAIKLTVTHLSRLPTRMKTVLRKIKISERTPYVWLMAVPTKAPHTIYLHMRSTLALLNYLSKGVDVPLAHSSRGFAPLTYTKDGKLFNWREVTQGMIRIKSAPYPPKNVFTSVQYNDYWFYIDQADTNSKESFSLINILMEVNQGKVLQKVPLFTIS